MSDIEWDRLIEHVKKIGQNERLNQKFKTDEDQSIKSIKVIGQWSAERNLKCRKNIEKNNSKVSKTKNAKIMLLSRCAVSGYKKSKFMKEREASGLMSQLGIRTPLSKIPLLGNNCF